MMAFESATPITQVISLKSDDLLLHRPATGFHQMMMVRAISQQKPDAIMSGVSCLYSWASAASAAAERIQSCARFNIMSKARRACQTAILPRPCGLRDSDLAFISTNLTTNSKHLTAAFLNLDHIQRTRRRAVKDFTSLCTKTTFVAGTLEPVVCFGIINWT